MVRIEEISTTFHDEIGLDTLRRQALFTSTAACPIAAIGLMLALSRPSDTEWWVGAGVLALYAIGVLTFLAAHRGIAFAGLVLVGGWLILTTATIWIPPLAWMSYLTPALALLAFTFAGPAGGLITAVTVSVVFWGVFYWGGPVDQTELIVIPALTWANALLTWLRTR